VSVYDAPNQQVVRGDGSGPGASEVSVSGEPPAPAAAGDEGPGADATKQELLDYAAAHGLDVDEDMTKAEIREVIDAG
jgi:hypothetical protein